MNDAVHLGAGVAAAESCDWPVTNCYIDAWLLVLRAWGFDPVAGLGVTVTQDYEGDQFTFFKYLHEDLEKLYGIVVGELNIWHDLERHVAVQVGQGRLALVEVDGYYLPDTRATSYRTQHSKTTIGIDFIDPAAGRLTYYHNSGRFELAGEDYQGVFQRLPGQNPTGVVLPPYVEVVRRRPDENPVGKYRAVFARDMDWLMSHPELFHEYAFGGFRQLGSNFQLLAAHLRWLEERGIAGLNDAICAANSISASAKAMQFKVARIASRRRFDPCEALFTTLEQNYDSVFHCLVPMFG